MLPVITIWSRETGHLKVYRCVIFCFRKCCRLQQGQNFAACIITGLWKYDYISPALEDLGWPSVKDLFIHRNLIMMYKYLKGLVPNYLSRNIIRRFDIHGISTKHFNDINLSKCRTSLTAYRMTSVAMVMRNSRK